MGHALSKELKEMENVISDEKTQRPLAEIKEKLGFEVNHFFKMKYPTINLKRYSFFDNFDRRNKYYFTSFNGK